MSEVSDSGIDRGLARLRLRLGAYEPALIARSHLPISALFRDLVADARDAGRIEANDPEAAAYLLTSLNSSFVITQTLGNDFGLDPPDVVSLAVFCLLGLDADVDRAWAGRVSRRVRLPNPSTPKAGTRRPKRSRSVG
jgi:hypothetical protein